MTGCNRIIFVVCSLCTSNDMSPPSSNLSASRNRDHIVVFMLDILVASKVGILDILNRVVGVWSSDAFELPLVYTINRQLLKDSMAGSASGEDR